MIIFYAFLAACLGAYVGKLMAMAVHFLPIILLEEFVHENENNHVPRDILTWFFRNQQCFNCKKSILWWQNLPIISYFVNKGECQSCQQKLGLRLILLEVGMALIFGITGMMSHSTEEFIFVSLIITLLICCFITDLEYGILPDQFTLSLLWVGLVGSLFNLFITPREAIIGAIAGYAFFWLINEFFRFYRNEDGMFPGDFKFNAALGACLGIYQLLPILLLALILVIITTVIKYFYAKKPPIAIFIKQEISYGCYVAIVAFNIIFIKLYTALPQNEVL